MNNLIKAKQENLSTIIDLSDKIDKYLHAQERNADMMTNQAYLNALTMTLRIDELIKENKMLDLVYFCQHGKYPA